MTDTASIRERTSPNAREQLVEPLKRGWRHSPRSLTRRPRVGLAMVAPALLFVVAFVLFPLAFALYISLTDWPLIGPHHFIGLTNYVRIPTDTVFLQSVIFTLTYTAIVTGPIFFVGYGLAVLVRANRPGSSLFRTAFFLPYVVGLATESFILLLELQPNSGMINVILEKLGITNGATAWLVDTNLAVTATCVLVVWYASGLTMLLLMAGMQGIPEELYQSAKVDGASWLSRELRITVPLLRRTIAMCLILSVIGSFLAFDQFYILTQGGPGTSTTTVVQWIYQKAFVHLQVGSATALSVVLILVVGAVSAAQFFLLRDKTEES